MRQSIAIVLMTGLTLVACSKSEDKPTVTTSATTVTAPATAPTPPATAAAPATAPAASPVVASADMNTFMSMCDGKDGSVRKALKKFGAKAVQGDDLGMYMLSDAKVTKSEKVGDLQCYTMQSTAGVMTHTTQICWDAKGKISKITDTSA